MKKTILLILTIAIAFVACNKDDNGNTDGNVYTDGRVVFNPISVDTLVQFGCYRIYGEGDTLNVSRVDLLFNANIGIKNEDGSFTAMQTDSIIYEKAIPTCVNHGNQREQNCYLFSFENDSIHYGGFTNLGHTWHEPITSTSCTLSHLSPYTIYSIDGVYFLESNYDGGVKYYLKVRE